MFLDGVRINEPFGDVVNWDLIPQAAINTIQIDPRLQSDVRPEYAWRRRRRLDEERPRQPGRQRGSDGFGSWGRKTAQIEQGGVIGSNLDYYFTANVTNDNGWADHNSSRLRQAFGKLRYTDADTTISLSMGGADNDLKARRPSRASFLDNRRQAYTFPDTNENQVGYLTLSADHYFNAEHRSSAATCTTGITAT